MSKDLRHTQRLFIECELSVGKAISLDTPQAHYLQNVLRLKVNDIVRVFNGRQGEWQAVLTKIQKRETELTIQKQLRAQLPMQDLWLCAAPIKRAHFDYMIEKATELGITDFHPVLTSRTQVREMNEERCQAIAIEAAEQSDRLSIPKIAKPRTLAEVAASWPHDRVLIVCAEWGEALSLKEALASNRMSKTAIMTGPEGGFAGDELEILKQISSAIFVRLGPRILRADTAAIAALSCWQAMRGDW